MALGGCHYIKMGRYSYLSSMVMTLKQGYDDYG
jgi:hypothetical protein